MNTPSVGFSSASEVLKHSADMYDWLVAHGFGRKSVICCAGCLFRRYIREVCVVFRGPAIEKLQDSLGFLQYCLEARAFMPGFSEILQGDNLDRQIPAFSGCRRCKRAEATVNTEARLCSSLLGRVVTRVERKFERGLRYFPHAQMAERVGFICEQGGHKCSLV